MCGIAGYYGIADKKLIKQFSKELAHRGPDGEGIFQTEQVSLLNRRLAIIDLKTGDQPIYNEDRSLVVVYNGEIYNYKQLRRELEELGHRFKTLSDTEVIVHGYEQWGEHCFDRCNGMFAVALYDMKREELILARDHFGIKPLYFAVLPDKSVLFSSEIKPIIHSGLVTAATNEKVLYRYLTFRVHSDGPETFFKDVYSLMPGQFLKIRKKTINNGYFSRLEEELKELAARPAIANDDATDSFKSALVEAITRRLIADVPVGTCLSGGLDSSTVVSVVNTLLRSQVDEARSIGAVQKSFSAVFPRSTNDEERYIDELIRYVKKSGGAIESYKVHPKPEQFFEEIEDFVRTQEEPTISTGPYAQYCVMRMVQGKVKVLLDGQGADEMMAGYLPYYFVYLRQLWTRRNWLTLAVELLSSIDVLVKYAALTLGRMTGEHPMSRILRRQFVGEFSRERFTPVRSNLKLRLIEDIFYNSLPSLLRYEDKNSMRFSIEGRVPFLDVNLMRALFTLPDSAVISRGWNKRILREATKDLLPNLIRKRRNKIGFTTPEQEWFLRMKNKIYSIFLSPSFAARPYFNQQAVLRHFQRFIEGKNDDTLLFWRLLNTELWLREFIDDVKTPLSAQEKPIRREVTTGTSTYERTMLKTPVFQKDDPYAQMIDTVVQGWASKHKTKAGRRKWFVVVSEKIIAISQGRSYFIWDIKTGFWARLLSKYVTKTPYGIGLGSEWTMQLAIREVGLPKILLATILSAVTKPFGIRGVFYRVTGEQARSIDGPTEYSLYPSNVSAKLAPHNPPEVAEEIATYISDNLPSTMERQFMGVVVIDANDIGRNIMANTTGLPDNEIAEIFRDNPMGQGAQQTPVTVVCVA